MRYWPGSHEQRLVERVLVEVAARGAGEHRAGRGGRPGPAARRTSRRPARCPPTTSTRVSVSSTGTREHRVFLGRRPRRPARASPRCAPVGPSTQAEHGRADGQHDHRDRHDLRRLVRVRVVGPAALAVEGHEEQARHVERGDAGAEQRGAAEHPRAPAVADERRLDDLVLGAEAGERRDADDRQLAEAEGDPGDLHDGARCRRTGACRPGRSCRASPSRRRGTCPALKKPCVSRWKIANT